LGLKHQKGFRKYTTGGSKIKKEKLISGSSRGNFWQPSISPEARKERSCQSFSAPHVGPRADCPFHRPAFFRPGDDEEVAQHGGHIPNNRLTEICSLVLPCTSLISDKLTADQVQVFDWIVGSSQVNLLKTGQDCSEAG